MTFDEWFKKHEKCFIKDGPVYEVAKDAWNIAIELAEQSCYDTVRFTDDVDVGIECANAIRLLRV